MIGWMCEHLRNVTRGATLKYILSPIIIKLTGHAAICLMRMYSSLRGEQWSEVDLFLHVHQNLVCWWKILVRTSYINYSAFETILRHGLAFKYYLVVSKNFPFMCG